MLFVDDIAARGRLRVSARGGASRASSSASRGLDGARGRVMTVAVAAACKRVDLLLQLSSVKRRFLEVELVLAGRCCCCCLMGVTGCMAWMREKQRGGRAGWVQLGSRE